VFTFSALVILLFVIVTLALQNEVAPLFQGLRDWLTGNMSWFFIGGANVFVLLTLGLIFTPLGKVRLGGRRRHRISVTRAGSPCCLPPAWALV